MLDKIRLQKIKLSKHLCLLLYTCSLKLIKTTKFEYDLLNWHLKSKVVFFWFMTYELQLVIYFCLKQNHESKRFQKCKKSFDWCSGISALVEWVKMSHVKISSQPSFQKNSSLYFQRTSRICLLCLSKHEICNTACTMLPSK